MAKVTLKKTRKFGKKRFSKKSSHSKKTNANKAAKSARKSGKLARIVKTKSHGYTVYTHGK